MEFKASPMSIDDVLRLKRKYVIPRFQREYSWENDELLAIWEDLWENIICDGTTFIPKEYFLGSLVLVGDDDSPNIERQIVDGQQRLMTFTIAFSALVQAFAKISEDKLRKATFSYIMAEDSDGNEYPKLIAETPKPYFQYRIQYESPDVTKIPKSVEEKRILSAYKFFERNFEEKNLLTKIRERYSNIIENISYRDALKAFRDQILICKVVYVTVKNFEDAYTIFEVLNAKGKDLTALDIIKNSIFSILTQNEPLDEAYIKWNLIKENMANCSEDIVTFYRHFWLSNFNFTTEKNLVKNFQKQIPANIDSYKNFLNKIQNSSLIYKQIVQPTEADWNQPENLIVYRALNALSIFSTSQVRTFLLALLEMFKVNNIRRTEYIKILSFLEHFHFIFTAVCHMRASGLERRYSSYARKLRSCKNKQESSKCISELITVLKESIPSYEIFEDEFIKIKYTSDQGKQKKLVQYILKRVEASFTQTQEVRPLSFTIEHIIAESTRSNFVGMIGNLLPLGEKLNNELADKPWAEKIETYSSSQYISVKNFIDTHSHGESFDENDVINRTKQLSKKLYSKSPL